MARTLRPLYSPLERMVWLLWGRGTRKGEAGPCTVSLGPLIINLNNCIRSPKGQRLGNRPAQSHGSKVSRAAVVDDSREQGTKAAGLPKRFFSEVFSRCLLS